MAAVTGPNSEAGFNRSFTALLWIFFIVAATHALAPIFPQTEGIDKYFWLSADVATVFWFALYQKQAMEVCSRNKLLLSWGGLACLSALWSLNPELSLYRGIQLVMTIMVALMLSARMPRLEILKLIFIAFLLVQFLSLLLVVIQPETAFDGHKNLRGSLTHKNQLGVLLIVQLITSIVLFLQGWKRWLTGFVIILTAFLLILSGSMTSLLAALPTLLFVPIAFLYRNDKRFIPLITGAMLIFTSLFFYAEIVFGLDLLGFLLESVGKDRTFTGRTEIWRFGMDAIATNPVLGIGYEAYWNSDATTYLNVQYAMRHEVGSFHNSLIEVTVAMGVVGLTLVLATLLSAFVAAVRGFIARPSYTALWPLLLLVFISLHSTSESTLAANHGVGQFLVAIALAARDKVG